MVKLIIFIAMIQRGNEWVIWAGMFGEMHCTQHVKIKLKLFGITVKCFSLLNNKIIIKTGILGIVCEVLQYLWYLEWFF